MHLEPDITTHSRAQQPYSNGTSRPQLTKGVLSRSTNGKARSHATTNGSTPSQSNGSRVSSPRTIQPDYFGHDREEVTRILIQSLNDLGYHVAAGALSRESGYEVETPTVAAFRNAVLQGEWDEAEGLLFGSDPPFIGKERRNLEGLRRYGPGLALAEGADKLAMLFSMREQKFLELLEQRELAAALMVLRQELSPMHRDIGRLHALSR